MKKLARYLKLQPLRDGNEGQALVLVCVGLLFTLLMAGLGVDVGYLRYQKHQMQKAADAGALAAAVAQIEGGDWQTAGRNDARMNGFNNGLDGTLVDVWSPPRVSPLFKDKDGYVEVVVTQPRPNFFLRLLGPETTTVSSRAVASVNGSGSGCIYAMDPKPGDTGLLINGTDDVSSSCGVYVRSTGSDALHINGNGTLNAGTAGAGIGVVGPTDGGGWNSRCTSGGCTPTPSNIPPFQDPLIDLAQPPAPTKCDPYANNYNGNTDYLLSPGVYCGGINISGNGTITFKSGLYTICGGGIKVQGNRKLVTDNGDGVMFFNTGKVAGVCQNKDYAPISLKGTTGTNLYAPTSGTYEGILVFQDRAYISDKNNDASSFDGTSDAVFTGALYFPGTNVTYSGNPKHSVASLIVAWQITFNGKSSINNDLLIGGGSPIKTAALAE